MSNIDLSQLVTPEDKEQRLRRQRTAAAKTECRRRIVAVADQITQMNLASALLTHDAVRQRGGTADERAAASGLSEADVATVLMMRGWIAEMQAACAAIAADPAPLPADDTRWPPPPEGLAALAARF